MVGLLWEKNLEVQCGVRDWTACVVTCFLEGAWIGQNLHSYQLYTVDSPVAVAVGQTSGDPETFFKYTYPPFANWKS